VEAGHRREGRDERVKAATDDQQYGNADPENSGPQQSQIYAGHGAYRRRDAM
jgi:hypothetical protein